MVDDSHEHPARRTAVPFIASRPGDVPPAGTPTIAGVQLPSGIPCPVEGVPAYWRTLEPVDDPGRLTSSLAGSFAQTGLWPLLYAWEEEPEHYWLGGPGVSDDVAVDVEQVMRSQWESWKQATWGPKPIFPEFPGLAEPQPSDAAGANGDPFAVVSDDARREPWQPRRWLLLVPCRRPADILAVVGWDFSQMPYSVTTAVLRSWEERFAAVPVEIDVAAIVLNIGRPPQHSAQAERLVAEFAAVCELEIRDGEDDWLQRTASLLLPGSPVQPLAGDLSRTHWRVSFKETPPDALLELTRGLP